MQYVFLLLVGLGCISTISSQQCYSCTTNATTSCRDPFNANSLNTSFRENLPANGACLKLKQLDAGDSAIVIRTSTSDTSLCPGGIGGCGKVTQFGVTGTACCCTGNLCNGMSRIQQQPLLTILLLTITTFAMFIDRHF